MASAVTNIARSAPGAGEQQPAQALGRRLFHASWLSWLLFAFVAALCAGLAIRYLAAAPSLAPALAALSRALMTPAYRAAAETLAAALAVVAGLWAPHAVLKRTRPLSRAFSALAIRRRQAIVFAGLLPMVIRLGLLPVLGVPEPLIADEFGYLLIADTLASGRLANPPHPFWQHFETIYAFHQPVYASIYPVAPALLLLAAKVAGVSPWLGVWAGAGLMCALICWMLQGWTSPKWALAGALIAACRFAIIGPWMNTYWGGAAAAAGGALLLGALPRLTTKARIRDSVLFGLGLMVLAQSRPYEGFLLSIPVVVTLAVWLIIARRFPLRVRVRNVALPLGAAAVLLMAGTAYYNSRVTGHPLLMPYGLHQKIYGTPQSFYWQSPIRDAPGIHRHDDIAKVFRWQLDAYESQFSWASLATRLHNFWQFYLDPLLTVPLLLLPWICTSWRLAVPLIAGVVVMTGNSLYPFFFPHYAAPLCALVLLLIVQGMRRLRLVRWRSAPAGRAVVTGLFLLTFASASVTVLGGLLQPFNVSATDTPRGHALRKLQAIGGKHLVLVRYSPQHSFHYGVVYNDADIDHAQVVWARELDEDSNKKLLAYFHDRSVWRFNPDELPAELVPFTTRPFISKVASGAGRRDDTRDGISAGSIAVLLGGNLTTDPDGSAGAGILGRLPFRVTEVSAEYGNLFAPADTKDPAAHDTGSASRSASPAGEGCPDDVSVRFGDFPATVLGVFHLEGQEAITVRAPSSLHEGWTTVAVRVCHGITTKRVRVLPASPGIFQARMGDSRVQAILLRDGGGTVDAERPARRGEALHLFATGLGPAVRSGSSLVVGVNHRGARLLAVSPAVGMPGVFDVAFETPPDAPSGMDVPLSIGVVVNGRTVYSNKSSMPVE